MLHCAGQVSMMPNGAGGSALPALDRSRFADAGLGSREAFYGQLNAVIGEYFQYGPRFQAAYPEIDRRFADVSYLDLAENPVGTVADIYRHFGWVFDDETRARTERWQDRQAERRQAEPRHRYSLARYGLTAPQVDEAFVRYADFVRGNKVRLD